MRAPLAGVSSSSRRDAARRSARRSAAHRSRTVALRPARAARRQRPRPWPRPSPRARRTRAHPEAEPDEAGAGREPALRSRLLRPGGGERAHAEAARRVAGVARLAAWRVHRRRDRRPGCRLAARPRRDRRGAGRAAPPAATSAREAPPAAGRRQSIARVARGDRDAGRVHDAGRSFARRCRRDRRRAGSLAPARIQRAVGLRRIEEDQQLESRHMRRV